MADSERPDVCGRMYHGATFDTCKLPPRHTGEDHHGRRTGIRYRDVPGRKTVSEFTGIGERTVAELETPTLFSGEQRAS